MVQCLCASLTVKKKKGIFTFSPFTPLQSHLDKDVHPWQAFKDIRGKNHLIGIRLYEVFNIVTKS